MTTLKEGDKAPDFKVINELGDEMILADFLTVTPLVYNSIS